MFLFLLTLAVAALWIYQLVLSSRLQSDRDDHLIELNRLIADYDALRQRTFRLEEVAKRPVEPVSEAVPTVTAPLPAHAEPWIAAVSAAAPPEQVEEVKSAVAPPTLLEAAPAPAGSYASQLDHEIGEGLPEPRPKETSGPVPVPVASVGYPLFQESKRVEPADVEPARQEASGQGWEAALGGDWLNKIGVLLLVVGLVLFIGYSFSMMGPAGRVAVSLAVSASMLTAGVALERREKYRVAARGLIGGGWAGLYATTFAAHGIEAAKVIEDPTLATLLLAAVALGMVLHSLRYRSQVVTGVAYFVAFVTLAITQLTVFAVVALVPLAASLLYLAYRFRWTGMALVGLPATYGIYMLHAARSSGGSLALGQTILFVYWLVFEGFDLLESARTRASGSKASGVFPLNVIFFTAVSTIQWAAASEPTLYQFFVLAAGAYLASSLVRALILPPAGFPAGLSALDRAVRGSYEGSATLAATFAAVAVALKLSGLSLAVALMAEAELLFLAGLAFRQRFLRHLATALFVVANARLVVFDVSSDKHVTIAGSQWYAWSPVALLEAAVFYLNRFVSNRGAFYSSFAAGLLTLVLGFEMPLAYLGLAWVLLALILFEFGGGWRLRDFTIQSYCVGLVGLFALLMKNVGGTELHTDWHGWLPQLLAAILLYAVTTRIGVQKTSPDSASPERLAVRYVTSTTGTVLALVFLANVLRLEFLGLAWLLLAVASYEFGLATRLREFVVQGYILGAGSLAMLVARNVLHAPLHTGWQGWLPQLASAAVLYAVTTRVGFIRSGEEDSAERKLLRYVASTFGTVVAATFLLNILPAEFAGFGWLLLAVVLCECGLAGRRREFVVQSYLAGAASMAMLVVKNVMLTGLHTDWHGWLPQLASAAVLYALAIRMEIFGARSGSLDERELLRDMASLAGTVLTGAFLANTLPESLVAVGWAVLGLALLAIGTRLGYTALRVQSYILAAIVFARTWAVNLNLTDDFAGLPVSVLTVAAVIASFYAAELLSPRPQPGAPSAESLQKLEANVRFFFSFMATALLTVLLFRQVSGRMLTVAWGVEGLGLLFAGFPLRERSMRFAGLFLLLVCVLKLFAWDLRNLEMPFRVLSFIVLGVILIGVSFFYSRFRERISRYM